MIVTTIKIKNMSQGAIAGLGRRLGLRFIKGPGNAIRRGGNEFSGPPDEDDAEPGIVATVRGAATNVAACHR